MAFESTITEHDLDAGTQQYLRELGREAGDAEPDLSVDGLSDSIFSRLLGLFGVGRS